MATIALFLYPLFMVFELLMFAVIAITLFLSIIAVNSMVGSEQLELGTYIGSVLMLWVIGNGIAFLVYLVVSALH